MQMKMNSPFKHANKKRGVSVDVSVVLPIIDD